MKYFKISSETSEKYQGSEELQSPHLGKDRSLEWGLISGDVFPLRYLLVIVKIVEESQKLSRAFDRLIGLREKENRV